MARTSTRGRESRVVVTAWAFCLAYQEETVLPYWVRHYRTFCERVIVYLDTDTTDNSEKLALAEGAEVRPYVGSGYLDDILFINFAEENYVEARNKADWVIWSDADEFLYHPSIIEKLDMLRNHGVTVPAVVGYDMFADAPPSGSGHIYDLINTGVPSANYGKVCIFDPSLQVRWSTGKHTATIDGYVVRDDGNDPLKLLHYRWLGEAWHLARNARNYARLNAENIARQHGKEIYPGAQGLYTPEWYKEQALLAVKCI